jgi:general secretion pathway protein D
MSKQIDMRWEMDGPNIAVMKDRPYLKTYIVDYVNVGRDATSTVGVQTQVVGPSVGGAQGTSGGGGSQNSSTLKIENTAKNRFWETLKLNINEILADEEKLINRQRSVRSFDQNADQTSSNEVFARGTGSASSSIGGGSSAVSVAGQGNQVSGQGNQLGQGAVSGRGNQFVQGSGAAQQSVSAGSTATTGDVREAATVIMNPETGTISVRASSRFHEKIGQFIETVAGAAKRQVLIEVTVVEVVLDDGYQSGVDWSSIGLQGLGYSIRQTLTRSNPTPTGTTLGDNSFSIAYANPNAAAGGSISSTLKLLSSFGSTKVLSSPRTTTLNNQTAVMKVVENKVYFTVSVTPATRNETTGVTTSPATYTTTPNIVPEGFVMSVTPQIAENDVVNLSIRPTITRIVDYINDPNPDLRAGTPNRIPQVQTREFETMLRIPSGQTAVLGGLMQDSFVAKRDGLPGLSRIPIFGDAVSYRNDAGRKSELVVFIRPIVIKDASLETDLSEYKRYLPDGRFFKEAEPFVNVPIPGPPDPVQPRP